jgi:CPA2 family monovalent cation:H+ antiporter-2
MHTPQLFGDLLIILLVSVPVAFICLRLKLPLLVGLMLTGIAIGPSGFGLIKEIQAVEMLAEIGVMLLLFTIGLEFSLKRLAEMKRLVTWGGGFQVAITVAVAAVAAFAFGRSTNQAVFIGFLVALSSTAIVLKTYADRAEIDSPHGRAGIGILLFQDLVIVPMMLLVPILSGKEGFSPIRIAITLGTAVLAVAAIVVAARFLMPFLLQHVVRLRSREIFVTFVVLASLGTAWLTAHFGLSLALGAFIAGLVLSESEYSHQIVADILPFRDIFNSVFFTSIGMLLSLEALGESLFVVLGAVVALTVAKALIVALVVRALGYSLRVATATGLGLAQIGEFSFILAKGGLGEGLLTAADYQIFLGASILSMIATPFLIKAAPRAGLAVQSLFAPDSLLEPSMMGFSRSGERPADHVVIVGYGLNGRNVARVLRGMKISYRVVELNAESVREARDAGEPIDYGDATRREVLEHLAVERARILVIAIADPTASRHIVHLARAMNRQLHILVRTRYMAEIEELLRLGANEVIPEEFETSLEIFGRVLARYGIPRMKIRRGKDLLRREGYQEMRASPAPATQVGSLSDVLEAAVTEALVVEDGAAASGKPIGELEVRKLTGGTIVAIGRDGETEVNPGPDFRLRPGDTVVLLGSADQIDAAIELLVAAGRAHAAIEPIESGNRV